MFNRLRLVLIVVAGTFLLRFFNRLADDPHASGCE